MHCMIHECERKKTMEKETQYIMGAPRGGSKPLAA